ncbi:hypothetical protein [Streptomyces sp. NPDC059122]|uniref:hypothetical protein n=1 Tax=Streptomyces sp. NPDC059122 TaxID=3346732 RepID=UPI0036ADD25F
MTRTYFSRTARDDSWWAALPAGNVPQAEPDEHQPADPAPSRPHNPAYALLAGLGRAEPRLTLSAADCTSLAPYVAEWLARGASPDQVLATLTAGLPTPVHHPARFVLSRLTAKLPPVVITQAPTAPATTPATPAAAPTKTTSPHRPPIRPHPPRTTPLRPNPPPPNSPPPDLLQPASLRPT